MHIPSMLRRVFALALVLGTSGCWSYLEDHCPGCTVIEHTRPGAPPIPAGAHTLVVLVHGAFGFGDEWDPVVAALRAQPGFAFFAYRWPGPWAGTPRRAVALAQTLQAALDTSPPSVTEVIVLAHSAGGMIAHYAARQLRVPPGRRVVVALLDAPYAINIAPPVEETRPNTPLGLAVGRTQPRYPPLPAGVALTAYVAADLPSHVAHSSPPREGRAPPLVEAPDVPRLFVGAVGHNPMVAKVALPLLAERAARAR